VKLLLVAGYWFKALQGFQRCSATNQQHSNQQQL
jgi:hypothetical protein